MLARATREASSIATCTKSQPIPWLSLPGLRIPRDAMSDAIDSPALFDIQMQQRSRSFARVALHGQLRLQTSPAREVRTAQDARDAGGRDPQTAADKAPRAALQAVLGHVSDQSRAELARTVARPA